MRRYREYLKVVPFRFTARADRWTALRNPLCGQSSEPRKIANHAKIMIIDDRFFYIGSQNLYPTDHQEPGAVSCAPAEDSCAPFVDCLDPNDDGLNPSVDCLAPNADGLVPGVDGLNPNADGLDPSVDGLNPSDVGLDPDDDSCALAGDSCAPFGPGYETLGTSGVLFLGPPPSRRRFYPFRRRRMIR